MARPPRRQCGNCKFWSQPDPAGTVSNRGTCSFLIGVELRSDRQPERVAPEWAYGLTRAMLSFDGQYCPTYKKGPNARPDEGSAL